MLYFRYNKSRNKSRLLGCRKGKVRRWGSSLGIVVPREIARALRLTAGDEVVVDLQRASGLEEAFRSLKDWDVDPQKLKDELRRGW